MTIKEKEDAMGAAMKANGAFWAFGDSQFDEQKDPAIDKFDYCHIFGGLICPKATADKMIADMKVIYPKA